MFKTATAFVIRPGQEPAPADQLHATLAAYPFRPTEPTQATSYGFVPPRPKAGEGAALVEELAEGQQLLAVAIESRQVPAAAVSKRVEELAKAIEEQTGRKPGKKARKDLKEQATHELMPQAFPKVRRVHVVLDWGRRRAWLDASSASLSDVVLTLLAHAGLPLLPLLTMDQPAQVMRNWLDDAELLPEGFWLGKKATLSGEDGTVSWTDCDLTGDDVQAHLMTGKHPARLALGIDERVSFELTAGMQLRSFKTLDIQPDEAAEAWLGETLLVVTELARAFEALEAAMGGHDETQVDTAGPAPAPTPAPEAENDPMYDQAVTVVVAERRASISLVQRHLRIGYNRAARLLERMERDGLVTPMKADGGRDVRAAA